MCGASLHARILRCWCTANCDPYHIPGVQRLAAILSLFKVTRISFICNHLVAPKALKNHPLAPECNRIVRSFRSGVHAGTRASAIGFPIREQALHAVSFQGQISFEIRPCARHQDVIWHTFQASQTLPDRREFHHIHPPGFSLTLGVGEAQREKPSLKSPGSNSRPWRTRSLSASVQSLLEQDIPVTEREKHGGPGEPGRQSDAASARQQASTGRMRGMLEPTARLVLFAGQHSSGGS